MVTGSEGIADFLMADPTDKEPEFGDYVVELVAFAAVVLVGTAWYVLLAVTMRTFGRSNLCKKYTGGT